MPVATGNTRPEAIAFRDVPQDKLDLLRSLGERLLYGPGSLEEEDALLQAAEQPMPVLSVNVHKVPKHDLPSIWMGMAMTEPGKGLRYAEDTEYIPQPNAPSTRVPIHGLEIPVAHDSVSTVKFFPFTLSSAAAEPTWWSIGSDTVLLNKAEAIGTLGNQRMSSVCRISRPGLQKVRLSRDLKRILAVRKNSGFLCR